MISRDNWLDTKERGMKMELSSRLWSLIAQFFSGWHYVKRGLPKCKTPKLFLVLIGGFRLSTAIYYPKVGPSPHTWERDGEDITECVTHWKRPKKIPLIFFIECEIEKRSESLKENK
jgi:hypothetical protein